MIYSSLNDDFSWLVYPSLSYGWKYRELVYPVGDRELVYPVGDAVEYPMDQGLDEATL